MSPPFDGRHVLLGVSGSIAVYKAVDLASKLTQAGALVDVLMSPSAVRFVAPLTFRGITHRDVLTDLFDLHSAQAIEHVALAKLADVLVVAPATAHVIGKLALGLSDDPISVVALATEAPLVVAPAMDANMWSHPAVQANAQTLVDRGARLVGPGKGRLASGLVGWGRLAEVPEIMGAIAQTLGANGDLAGRRIVVSAGGTQEPIDPVRVITNRSSGKMGYAIAEAARDRGASVILIAAPTALPDPPGIETCHVTTAAEMHDAVLAACTPLGHSPNAPLRHSRGSVDGNPQRSLPDAAAQADALIMAAAVADYTPSSPAVHKIKKAHTGEMSIPLTKTKDILAAVPHTLVKVGFAAESTGLIEHAKAKLTAKGLDFIVANDITLAGSGFGSDMNKVTLIDPTSVEDLPLMPKHAVATAILDRVAELLI